MTEMIQPEQLRAIAAATRHATERIRPLVAGLHRFHATLRSQAAADARDPDTFWLYGNLSAPFGAADDDGEVGEAGPFGVPPTTRCSRCGRRCYHDEVRLTGTIDTALYYICAACTGAPEGRHDA